MKSRLLILGASFYQVEAIRIAKNLGFEVVTADDNLANPGHAYADRAFQISTIDVEKLLRLAKSEMIDGVLAPCTDASLPAAAAVVQALHLHGAAPETVEILRHKGRFREFQRKNDLAHPDFRLMPSSVFDGQPPMPGPWIVKPCLSSGGRGVRILSKWEDARTAILAASRESLDNQWILEQKVEGSHYTLEGIMDNGRIRWAVLTRRTATSAPFAATIGHEIDRDSMRLEAAFQAVEPCLALAGYRNGVFDADIVGSNNQFIVLEATPRLGGNCLPRLIKVASSVDLTALALRFAIGEFYIPAAPRVTELKPAYVRLVTSDVAGTLHYNSARLAEVTCLPNIVEAEFDLPSGSPVRAFMSGRDRIGHSLGLIPAGRSAIDVHEDFLRFVECSIER